MTEKAIEKMLVAAVRDLGGLPLKLSSPGMAGVPDRLVLLPSGRCCFVELKAPGKTERPLQRGVQARLRALGFVVFSGVDSADRIAEVLRWCLNDV